MQGKYQALEVLLPQIGAHALLSSNNDSSDGCNFLYSLVNNLGLKENLPIVKVMADLWKQILIRHREEEGYIIAPSVNLKSDKKKKSKKISVSSNIDQSTPQLVLPKEWIETYVLK